MGSPTSLLRIGSELIYIPLIYILRIGGELIYILLIGGELIYIPLIYIPHSQ